MADKKTEKKWWDLLTMTSTKETLKKASETGKPGYTAPEKGQSTSYLQKQIKIQEDLKKEAEKKKKKKDPAMAALAGK